MDNKLIEKVESLKEILVSKATGSAGDEVRYKNLRRELIGLSRIKKHLPKVVLDCRNLAEFWGFIQPRFEKYAERREYLRAEFEELLNILETDSGSPGDFTISTTIQEAGLDYVQEVWHKALDRRATDPEGAITAARTLLETVCKHVLDSTGADYEETAELPKLYTLTAKRLNLSPSQHTEQLFKQILGGCQTVVEGLGAIRNRLSDAHGKGRAGAKPAQRHAELAVNLSGAMATFLLHTLAARKK